MLNFAFLCSHLCYHAVVKISFFLAQWIGRNQNSNIRVGKMGFPAYFTIFTHSWKPRYQSDVQRNTFIFKMTPFESRVPLLSPRQQSLSKLQLLENQYQSHAKVPLLEVKVFFWDPKRSENMPNFAFLSSSISHHAVVYISSILAQWIGRNYNSSTRLEENGISSIFDHILSLVEGEISFRCPTQHFYFQDDPI